MLLMKVGPWEFSRKARKRQDWIASSKTPRKDGRGDEGETKGEQRTEGKRRGDEGEMEGMGSGMKNDFPKELSSCIQELSSLGSARTILDNYFLPTLKKRFFVLHS